MFCANCGTKQNEGEKYCPSCGRKFEEHSKKEILNDISFSKTSSTKEKIENFEMTNTCSSINKVSETTTKQEEYNKLSGDIISENDSFLQELSILTNHNDINSILSWAIKYEYGLGVPLDMDKSYKLYAKIKDTNAVSNLLYPMDINEKTGVVSDAYIIERNLVFDSYEYKEHIKRERARRQRERQEFEERFNINDMYNITNPSSDIMQFKFYIERSDNFFDNIDGRVRIYNKDVEYYNKRYNCKYDKIELEYDEKFRVTVVKGIFRKISTRSDIGFWESLFINDMDKQREKKLLESFMYICEKCDSKKMKK